MEYRIRNAVLGDAKGIAAVEAACFPAAEAAPEEVFKRRITAFSDSFFVAESEGRIIGLINGCVTEEKRIRDEMFCNVRLHCPGGAYQAVFGLAVLPEYQKRGIAAGLMNRLTVESRRRGRRGVILTCKERRIPYYERFGFRSLGISGSVHGGAVWYDMILEFSGSRTE